MTTLDELTKEFASFTAKAAALDPKDAEEGRRRLAEMSRKLDARVRELAEVQEQRAKAVAAARHVDATAKGAATQAALVEPTLTAVIDAAKELEGWKIDRKIDDDAQAAVEAVAKELDAARDALKGLKDDGADAEKEATIRRSAAQAAAIKAQQTRQRITGYAARIRSTGDELKALVQEARAARDSKQLGLAAYLRGLSTDKRKALEAMLSEARDEAQHRADIATDDKRASDTAIAAAAADRAAGLARAALADAAAKVTELEAGLSRSTRAAARKSYP